MEIVVARDHEVYTSGLQQFLYALDRIAHQHPNDPPSRIVICPEVHVGWMRAAPYDGIYFEYILSGTFRGVRVTVAEVEMKDQVGDLVVGQVVWDRYGEWVETGELVACRKEEGA